MVQALPPPPPALPGAIADQAEDNEDDCSEASGSEDWDPDADDEDPDQKEKDHKDFAKILNDEELDLMTSKVWFTTFLGILVFANVQVFVLETDIGPCALAKCDGSPMADRGNWFLVELIITLLFCGDMIFHIYDYGPKLYFQGEPSKHLCGIDLLHCSDFFIVAMRFIDVCFLESVLHVSTGLKFLSMLRVIHLGRFVKSVRLINGFRELWLIMSGVGDTLKSVVWVLLLMLLVIWVFSILLTIVVGKAEDAGSYDYQRSRWSMDEYWGSVFKSLYSMFQVMTRDRWSDSLVWPLVRRSGGMAIIFIAFLTVMVLALLNTIVGCVVESTLASSRANEEKMGKEKQKMDQKIMESLEVIFKEADADGSGELDQEELHDALRKPKVRDRMRMLEIPYKDLDLLFSLLDEEGTGLIKTETFFRGCARLRGPAGASHLYHMSIDFDRSIKWTTENIDVMGSANESLSTLLNTIDDIELEIVQGDGDDKDPVLQNRKGRTRLNRMDQLRASANILKDDFSHEGSRMSTKEQRLGTKNSSLVRASLRSTAVPTAQDLGIPKIAGEDEPPPPPPMPKTKTTQPKDPSAVGVRRSVKGWNDQKGFQWGLGGGG